MGKVLSAILSVSHHISPPGELSVVPMTPVGEDNWKLAPGLSRTLPYAPFAFVDFSVYPFALKNCSHEYICSSEFCESF